ncbi:MAG: hypothetical protein M1153_00800 [Patescibacteria group bacterium]|nr:hypothetical protein [Patescibacteria group bacterium]
MKTRLERYRRRVNNVLQEQRFIIGDEEKVLIKKRTSNGRRYFYMVADRREGKRVVRRFIKIPENNTKKLLLPFQRQIEIAGYLKKKKIINTRGVIVYNFDPKKGTPFAVMETFPSGHAKSVLSKITRESNISGSARRNESLPNLSDFTIYPSVRCPPVSKKCSR